MAKLIYRSGGGENECGTGLKREERTTAGGTNLGEDKQVC